MKADKVVDQYYCWGKEQHDHLVSSESLNSKKIKITGCPRYDFAVQPWRNTLQPTGIPPGYILINTNFPLANPFFSKNSKFVGHNYAKNDQNIIQIIASKMLCVL